MEEVNDCMKTYTHPSRPTSSLVINQYPKISDNHVHPSSILMYTKTLGLHFLLYLGINKLTCTHSPNVFSLTSTL